MKLIIAIVQDDDAGDLIDGLTDEGLELQNWQLQEDFKGRNTTLMIGVEEER